MTHVGLCDFRSLLKAKYRNVLRYCSCRRIRIKGHSRISSRDSIMSVANRLRCFIRMHFGITFEISFNVAALLSNVVYSTSLVTVVDTVENVGMYGPTMI